MWLLMTRKEGAWAAVECRGCHKRAAVVMLGKKIGAARMCGRVWGMLLVSVEKVTARERYREDLDVGDGAAAAMGKGKKIIIRFRFN